jgi:hypothetical protein
MATVTVTFSYDSDEHKRLHRWIEGLPKRGRSEAIRNALADHLGQDDVTHRDILNAIERLEWCGVAMAAQEETDSQEDPELAEALENLSKLGL